MIHVLSPHRDDAVFSLFFTLMELNRRGTPIIVRNFFTRSAYAPHAQTTDAAIVSEIRKREDRAALRRISQAICVRDCGLVDAPLRLGIPASQVCYTRPNQADIEIAARELPARLAGIHFVPLGLGGHVDHLTVRYAALRGVPAYRLAFYEDLPYAMWSAHQIRPLLEEIENLLSARLNSAIVRGDSSVLAKRAACARYRSQIKPEEANAMAAWSRCYGCGERIWIPRRSPLLRLI